MAREARPRKSRPRKPHAEAFGKRLPLPGFLGRDATLFGVKIPIAGIVMVAALTRVAITIFFEDRKPAGPFRFEIPAQRTKHLRFNNFKHPEEIPRDTPYSSVIESDVPIVVQYTRLDSRQPANALLSTIAFSE